MSLTRDLEVCASQCDSSISPDRNLSCRQNPVSLLPEEHHGTQVLDVAGQGQGLAHLDPVEAAHCADARGAERELPVRA